MVINIFGKKKRLLIKENFICYKKYLHLNSHYKGELLLLHSEISGYLPADASSPLNKLPLWARFHTTHTSNSNSIWVSAEFLSCN